MLKKTHVLALTVATAGLIGFTAPMASAATMDGPGGLVNVSNNQVPVQGCGNDVYINGIGAQVPVEGSSAVVPLLSPSSFNSGTSNNNRGCAMLNNQQNRHGDDGGLVNVSNNQIPVQVCGNDVYGNVIGAQVPLEALGILVPVLSSGSVNTNKAVNNRGCASANNQENGGRHAEHGDGKCPCGGSHSESAGMITSKQGARPAVGGVTTSKLGGNPVGGLTTPDLGGNPVGGLTSGLQVSK